MFLHEGWLHLLGNMLFLAAFGNNIEDRMRKIPFLIFYLASGYVAAYGFRAGQPVLGHAAHRRSPAPSLGSWCRLPGALSPGEGLEPGAIPVLHTAPHPCVGRAG